MEVAAVQELLLALLSSRENPSTPDELKHHHSSLIPPFEPPNERISFAVRFARRALPCTLRRESADFAVLFVRLCRLSCLAELAGKLPAVLAALTCLTARAGPATVVCRTGRSAGEYACPHDLGLRVRRDRRTVRQPLCGGCSKSTGDSRALTCVPEAQSTQHWRRQRV